MRKARVAKKLILLVIEYNPKNLKKPDDKKQATKIVKITAGVRVDLNIFLFSLSILNLRNSISSF